ncbi:MAG: hypothetical protein ACYTEY_03180 [Planctomycetota bacterium]|jgi:hypothetical protein
MKRKIARLAGRRRNAQGVAAVAMVVILLIIDLAIVGIVVGLSRDHDLTIRRMQTIEALYAAAQGMALGPFPTTRTTALTRRSAMPGSSSPRTRSET